MPKHLDTSSATFDCTGEFDFRNASMLITIGTELPTIVRQTGQLFYQDTLQRLYYTLEGKWYYLEPA